MNAIECPKCKSEETFCVNDFMEYALELRECENCGCKYEVHYKLIVKDIKIKS
jgi:Zn ribbon nucleic-acid-binding protein